MERERMTEKITEYAERHDMSHAELWMFVGDVTGSYVDTAADGADLLSRLSPSELELVHEVVLGHDDFESRRAS